MACSSNCTTQNHESWGACVKAKGIKAQWLGGVQASYGEQKRFSATNARYRQAIKDGLEPAAVSDSAVNRAYEEAAAA